MLEKSKKPIKNKAFLPILLLVLPFTAYAISFSILADIFKNSDKKELLANRNENLQKLKVFEPNKILADEEIVDTKSLSIIDENDTSFETKNDFIDSVSDNHSENAIYTVQKSDSIFSIASYFGVSVETIMAFNHLNSKSVHEGDILEVPSVSGVPYKIGNGDTLEKISKKYNIDTEDIALYNGLQEDEMLVVGDEIFVPNARETVVVPKITTITNTKVVKNVKKNDEKIIANTGTFVKDIAAVSSTVKWARGDTAHLNTPAAIAKNSSLPKYEGYFLFPAPGATRTQKMHGNNGCDLANKIGSPVLAAASGVVTVAKNGGYNFGYGNYIKIKHANGTETLYGHLSRVDVSVGQSVSRGEQIGAVGSTGNSTGPHLHFEIHGAYNPFAW